MHKIKLSKDEYYYLCKSLCVKDEYRKLLFSSQREDNVYVLKISENQADEIRDLCCDQLPITGFSEKYELTDEGIILESLVDKFFTGNTIL